MNQGCNKVVLFPLPVSVLLLLDAESCPLLIFVSYISIIVIIPFLSTVMFLFLSFLCFSYIHISIPFLTAKSGLQYRLNIIVYVILAVLLSDAKSFLVLY